MQETDDNRRDGATEYLEAQLPKDSAASSKAKVESCFCPCIGVCHGSPGGSTSCTSISAASEAGSDAQSVPDEEELKKAVRLQLKPIYGDSTGLEYRPWQMTRPGDMTPVATSIKQFKAAREAEAQLREASSRTQSARGSRPLQQASRRGSVAMPARTLSSTRQSLGGRLAASIGSRPATSYVVAAASRRGSVYNSRSATPTSVRVRVMSPTPLASARVSLPSRNSTPVPTSSRRFSQAVSASSISVKPVASKSSSSYQVPSTSTRPAVRAISPEASAPTSRQVSVAAPPRLSSVTMVAQSGREAFTPFPRGSMSVPMPSSRGRSSSPVGIYSARQSSGVQVPRAPTPSGRPIAIQTSGQIGDKDRKAPLHPYVVSPPVLSSLVRENTKESVASVSTAVPVSLSPPSSSVLSGSFQVPPFAGVESPPLSFWYQNTALDGTTTPAALRPGFSGTATPVFAGSLSGSLKTPLSGSLRGSLGGSVRSSLGGSLKGKATVSTTGYLSVYNAHAARSGGA
eukprot:TRINITY_DN11751_c0_g1_i1.p1 TRINITY_DN11751_c0_g1~~TRINITY_DN11751_c0_g1_i1.p1  ORF type:complete len:515 (+),score=72.59 TRINITY_DN11751_c0_g1_i1:65-1609(+)